MWQKCIERAQLAQRIMTSVTMQLCKLLTSYTWTTQRSTELPLGA